MLAVVGLSQALGVEPSQAGSLIQQHRRRKLFNIGRGGGGVANPARPTSILGGGGGGGIAKRGARQFVENHFADTTIGRIRLLVDATIRRVRHMVEKNSQVRHLVEIVKSLFFDQTSYSTERRIYQMSLVIKKRKS